MSNTLTQDVKRSEVLFCVDLTVKDGRLLRDPNMYSLQAGTKDCVDSGLTVQISVT